MKRRQVDVENSGVVKRSDYTQVLEEIVAAGYCPFCEEHLMKHHRQPILLESDHWLVTENSWPYEGSRHHFLFIAKLHIEATEEAGPDVWADLQVIYRKVVERYKILGGTLMIRSGDTSYTGASVSHLHAHLIVGGPRGNRGDPIKSLVGYKK